MSFDKKLLGHLKQRLGFESDARLMHWSGISRNSMSGIQNERLAMGDSIRFVLLDKWWTHLRPKTVAGAKANAITGDAGASEELGTALASEEPAELSAQALLEIVRKRLDPPSAAHLVALGVSTPADVLLLDAYKIYKGCETNGELADLLGIKRNAISMVRTGHNKLGPLPLLKIFEDVCNAQHLGLHRAVQSSEALLRLFTQGSSATTS